MLNRRFIFITLGCATLSGAIEGAELIPTQLPSERMGYFRPQVVTPQQEAQQPQTDTQKISEQFYKDYALKYRGLKKPEKNELLRALSDRQKTAEKKEDGDRVLHYLRLQRALKGEMQ